jgi:Activator of Hsp90 ATPase homolog 1-like protein
VGGRWRFVNRHSKGAVTFYGEYREITPPNRLVFTEFFEQFPDSVSVVTTDFTDEDGKTRLIATVRYPPLEVRDIVLASGMATRVTYPVAAIGAIAPSTGHPANGSVWTAQDPNFPRAPIQDRGIHFAPRIGFAYDPFGKGNTAIRGGFGLFYNRLTWTPCSPRLPASLRSCRRPRFTSGPCLRCLVPRACCSPPTLLESMVGERFPR